MKATILSFLLVFSVGAANGQELLINISKFAWMSGCWERSDKAKSLLVSESWMLPAGTSMLGMGRTVKGDKTADYEFMRIEIRGMDYYFVAQPKANATETAFKLTTSQPTSATFENPDHDFPQRVIYRKAGRNKLFARVEGKIDGKDEGEDFRYTRTRCE